MESENCLIQRGPPFLFHSQLPHEVQPYVLEAGEGKQYIIDGQIHELIATVETTGGGFSHFVVEGAKGNISRRIIIKFIQKQSIVLKGR